MVHDLPLPGPLSSKKKVNITEVSISIKTSHLLEFGNLGLFSLQFFT